jgi:hypothetical protein
MNPSGLSLEDVKENLLSGSWGIIQLVEYIRLFARSQYGAEEDRCPLYHKSTLAWTINELQHQFHSF